MKTLLIALLMFTSVCCFAQSKEVRQYVHIPNGTCCVFKKQKPKKTEVKLPSTTTFKSTKTITVGGIQYTGDMLIEKRAGELIEVSTPNPDTVFKIIQGYKANIFQSKDTLYLNFWIVGSGGKNADACKVRQNLTRDPVGKFLIYPQVGEKYYIKLENRQSKAFWTQAFEIGALTIPFKYRFGHGSADPEITADIKNVSLFGGWQIGRVKYLYDQYEPAPPTKWTATIGPFLGVGKETLNKDNTNTARADAKNAAILSYGVAVLANIYDIRLGLHLGFDHLYGKYKSEWNYQNYPWIGFGIGFKLPYFQKID
jgi:hypothetical protein